MKTIRLVFNQLDTNGYGFITVDQFRKFLDSPDLDSLQLTNEEKDSVVSYCDGSGQTDGMINYKEFFKTFYSYLTEHEEDHETTLKQILIVTRHGHRFPLKCPTESIAWPKEKSFWKNYAGKLSTKGCVQHYHLGCLVRETYVKSLGLDEDDFTFPEKISVFTTNKDRTLTSASSHVEGLCPTIPYYYASDTDDNKSKGFQGIRIELLSDDSLLHGYKDNPAFSKINEESFKTMHFYTDLLNNNEEYRNCLIKLKDITGFEALNPSGTSLDIGRGMNDLYCLLEIEKCQGLPLLSNDKGLFIDNSDEEFARRSSVEYFHTQFYGNNDDEQLQLGRMGAGTFPSRVIQTFHERIEKEESDSDDFKSLVYYSAHDTTIYSLLSHFGFRNWEEAGFASILIFELHKIEGEYHVAIKYNPDPSKHPNLSDLRCYKMPIGRISVNMNEAEESMQSFVEFEDYLMNFKRSFKTKEEWKEECGVGTVKKTKDDE